MSQDCGVKLQKIFIDENRHFFGKKKKKCVKLVENGGFLSGFQVIKENK